jgi:hypothetical protein
MIPIYLIMTTGRTGSDYLQGCLDGLDTILSFCGKFEYHNFFKKNKNIKDNKKLIEKFVYENMPLFSYDSVEDIDKKVDHKKLINIFVKLSGSSKIDRKVFFLNLYKAYNLTINKDLSTAKALVHHSHGIINTKRCLLDFPDAKLFITIRDPRANLKSGLENWFKYDAERKNMEHVYLYIKRIREDLKFALKINNKKLFVKLESAGEINIKKEICSFLEVPYDQKIETATFNAKPWRGDVLSKSKSDYGEYNNKVKNNNWKNYFSEGEIKILNILYKDYIKFDYDIKKYYFIDRIKIIFSILNYKYFMKFDKSQKLIQDNTFKNIFYNFKKILYILKTFTLEK